MLQSEILLLCGVLLAIFGKIMSVVGRLGSNYVREQYEAATLAYELSQDPGGRKIIINTRMDRLESELQNLKGAHAQAQIDKSAALDRMQSLERLLSDNAIEIPE